AAVVEAVVRADSRLIGYSAAALRLRTRFNLTLLGISRAGRLFRDQLRERRIEPGDLLLLTGRGAMQQSTLDQLGVIPTNQVSIAPPRPDKILIAVGCFVGA